MILASLEKVKKSVAERLLFSIDNLQIHTGDKIGLIGDNGSGKSTLLRILAGEELPDEGRVYHHKSFGYLSQLNEKEMQDKSGGEQNKARIQSLLEKEPLLLVLDEPDNHLDLNTIEFIKNQLKHYSGAFLTVSHNRDLLDSICNKYWETDNGKVNVFNGRLQDLFMQKEIEKLSHESAYEKYVKEKSRLKKAMCKSKRSSAKIKKAPSRMGNSEARLHKMGDQKAKSNLDKTTNRIKTRLEQLEKIDKPKSVNNMQLDLAKNMQIHQPVLITGRNISKSFAGSTVFENADLTLTNGAKVALIGRNGAGKTTLLDMIHDRDPQMNFAHNLKTGYLGQFFSELRPDQNIIDNINRVSIYDNTFNRTILARLLFRTDSIYKKASVLSGGELTRVSMAMLFLGSYNLLLLDEPTNHLDMASIKAVEEALSDYKGTIIFTSHDKTFIDAVATERWQIANGRILALDT